MFKHQNKNYQKLPVAGEQPLMEGQEPYASAKGDGTDKEKVKEVSHDQRRQVMWEKSVRERDVQNRSVRLKVISLPKFK